MQAACAAGSPEAELARLEIATERDPLDVAQLTARGVLLDRLGRGEEAADLLETAALLAPEAPLAAAALANSLVHAGRFVQAVLRCSGRRSWRREISPCTTITPPR